jgi:hypothetical protein
VHVQCFHADWSSSVNGRDRCMDVGNISPSDPPFKQCRQGTHRTFRLSHRRAHLQRILHLRTQHPLRVTKPQLAAAYVMRAEGRRVSGVGWARASGYQKVGRAHPMLKEFPCALRRRIRNHEHFRRSVSVAEWLGQPSRTDRLPLQIRLQLTWCRA